MLEYVWFCVQGRPYRLINPNVPPTDTVVTIAPVRGPKWSVSETLLIAQNNRFSSDGATATLFSHCRINGGEPRRLIGTTVRITANTGTMSAAMSSRCFQSRTSRTAMPPCGLISSASIELVQPSHCQDLPFELLHRTMGSSRASTSILLITIVHKKKGDAIMAPNRNKFHLCCAASQPMTNTEATREPGAVMK